MVDLLRRWLTRVLGILRAPAEVEQLRNDLAVLQRDNLLMRAEVNELKRRSLLLEELGRSLNDTQKRLALAVDPSVLDAPEEPRRPVLRLVTNETSGESLARKEV